METLELVPFTRVGRIFFGMSENEVLAVLGKPVSRGQNHLGGLQLQFAEVTLEFDHAGVSDISIEPGTMLKYETLNLNSSEGLEALVKFSKERYTGFGVLVLNDFGLSLSNDLSTNEPINAFKRHHLDELIKTMVRLVN